MNSRSLQLRHGGEILVRPLKHGDVETVLAVFPRLAADGAKARLSEDEVWHLSRADENHHTLVAYIEGDATPVALAHLVRHGRRAEVSFEVSRDHQRRGIGSALTRELIADARAAGITEVTALVASDNPAALGLLRRVLNKLDVSRDGSDVWITAALVPQH